MSDQPIVRWAEASDSSELIRLIREFAGFEQLEHLVGINRESLDRALFTDINFCKCLVVESNDELIGYSIFYPIFRTFSGVRALHLEDLYISPKHQGNGLGRSLLKSISRYALENGFERIDLQVLDWNEDAIKFYERLGASQISGNLDFTFPENTLRALAK